MFGYASLADPASAAQTLAREVRFAALARLEGWRRRWTVGRDNRTSEKTFARAADGSLPSHCLGLDLEPDRSGDAEGPNGVLIEVSEAELERLGRRELRYRPVDVGNAIAPDGAPAGEHGFDAVWAFAARPEHHFPHAPPGAVVIAAYARRVEAAFAALGAAQLDAYRRTTPPPAAQLCECVLVRDQIPPGNPREW